MGLPGAGQYIRSISDHSSNCHEDARAFAPLFRFVGILALLWLGLAAVYFSLPYVRSGSDVVFAAKSRWVGEMPLFESGDEQRVLIFGSSKILSGFVPALFDANLNATESAHTDSYNLGFPDSVTYIEHLVQLLGRGEVPTHVLLTYTWDSVPPRAESTPFQFLTNDGEIMSALFPFRTLPRDIVLFSLRAPARGGLFQYYAEGATAVDHMRADRGYYFIEGQSQNPDDRLPDDYRVATDQPQMTAARQVRPSGPEFQTLRRMAQQYGIRFYLVPIYYRVGEFAPPAQPAEINPANADALRPYPEFEVLGPDYVVLPNADFSDTEHLNPAGAHVYTRILASLFSQRRNR